MKVILLKDVAKIGRRHEVVVVPDGFALNKLIPRGMAEAATQENLKRLQNVSSKQEQTREHDAASFEEVLSALKETQIHIEVDANAEGGMFQALKQEAISEAILKTTGKTIDKEHIVIASPIKTVGEHTVELKAGKSQGTAVLNLIARHK